jgi:N-acyl-D-amino-acid deacylase
MPWSTLMMQPDSRAMLTRKLSWMRHALVCAPALIALTNTLAAQSTTLIRGATLIDGTGAPRRTADVRIAGDRIREIGRLRAMPGERVIDAQGFVLAPGFVDTHSHHNRDLSSKRDALAMVSQGVTTIVVGQDGGGSDVAALFAKLDSLPAAVNVASYVGHGSVRSAVMGDDFRRAATPQEIERMKEIVRSEMRAGALGLSSGLEYDPGIYSTPAEVSALAKVAAEAGGRYISHIRSEDRDFWEALNEIITIGRVNRMPVQVSHIKLGMRDLWGQADSLVRVLDRARASGVDITADIYPYTYWQSNLGVFYPKRNFADSVETAFILAHLTPAEDIIFNSFPGHPEYVGKTLAQLASARGDTPVRTMLDLLAQPRGSGAGIIAKGMDERDVERLFQWRFANVCSDGMSTGIHPRGFGSFAKVVGPFVRDKKLVSLEEAVRKMTHLAATNVGLRERGTVAAGQFADLVLFDAAAIADRATFDAPQAQAVGVKRVWVNGNVVFDSGRVTGAYPGRALRRR